MMEVKKRQRIKEFLEWLEHLALFREWIWPFVPAVIAALAGYFQSLPLMWIVMATTLTAMGTVVAAMAVIMYFERRNPLNKLQHTIVFQVDLTPAKRIGVGLNRQQRRAPKPPEVLTLSSNQIDPAVPRTIDKAQLGVELTNISFYPISCFLEKAHTEIEGILPPRSDFPKPPYIFPPGGLVRLCDDIIDMEQYACGRLLGNINLDIKYGDSRKERFGIHVEGRVTISMDQSGLVTVIQLDPTQVVG